MLSIQFFCSTTHIWNVQKVLVTSGCHIGQLTHRTFPLLQDVLLDHTVLGHQMNHRQFVKECSGWRHKNSSEKLSLIIGAMVCRGLGASSGDSADRDCAVKYAGECYRKYFSSISLPKSLHGLAQSQSILWHVCKCHMVLMPPTYIPYSTNEWIYPQANFKKV